MHVLINQLGSLKKEEEVIEEVMTAIYTCADLK
jgi:hypothetical protein